MKKLFRLLLLVGIIIAIVKAVSAKKEWSGLSEAEARAKIDGKLARRVDDLEKRAEIADKVIEQMKTRGMIAPAPVQPVDDGARAAEAAEQKVEETGEAEPVEAAAEASDEPSSDESENADSAEATWVDTDEEDTGNGEDSNGEEASG